jgi:hypothetical protein
MADDVSVGPKCALCLAGVADCTPRAEESTRVFHEVPSCVMVMHHVAGAGWHLPAIEVPVVSNLEMWF